MASVTGASNKRETRTRTVSSNEAKQHWGAMMKSASEGEAVVVESHGKPRAVVISTDAYEEYLVLREKQRREDAIKWLQEFEASYDGRNDDLSQEQIDELADRAAHELFDELAAEGKLVFERDQHKP